MSAALVFPTAREVAVAIVTAARLHGDDPILTVEGAMGVRGRWLAIAALIDSFPDVPPASVGLWCGIRGGTLVKGALKEKLRANWWDYRNAEIVAEALASEIARTDAESSKSEAGRKDDDSSTAVQVGPNDFLPEFTPEPQAFEKSIAEYEASEAKAARKPPPEPPKALPSPAALAVADFRRSRPSILRTARGHIVDHRLAGVVNLGDPPPGRSALDQRGAP